MNSELSEINSIISICDVMIEETSQCGILKTGNSSYENYKTQIYRFLKTKGLDKRDYGPYAALDALWFSHGTYTVNKSEAETIKKIVVGLKHELFPESFEKIFISHREKDKECIRALVDLLHAIGIPRPTIHKDEKTIFCTSHPATYIENGKKNLKEIKNQFNSSDHIFFILWYSDEYFDSQACLNEAGAIWATNQKYQEILSPGFNSSKIGGLLDKQHIWFRANDKYRLNSFKAQLESMFRLDPIDPNAWELVREDFISKVLNMSKADILHFIQE